MRPWLSSAMSGSRSRVGREAVWRTSSRRRTQDQGAARMRPGSGQDVANRLPERGLSAAMCSL
jgi:hypothetical protein